MVLFEGNDCRPVCVKSSHVHDCEDLSVVWGAARYWRAIAAVCRDIMALVKGDLFYYHLSPFLNPTFDYHEDEEAGLIGAIEKSMYNHSSAFDEINDEAKFVEFLKIYFSNHTVEEVKSTFTTAKESILGSEYSKRGVFSSFGVKLLADLCSVAQIFSEYEISSGTSSGNVDGWEQYKSKNTRRKEAKEEKLTEYGGGRGGQGGPGGDGGGSDRGGGRRGGRNGGRGQPGRGIREEERGPEFGRIQIEEICVPSFVSPEKDASDLYIMQRRKATIKARTKEVAKNGLMRRFRVNGELFYDPAKKLDIGRQVMLFHGTRFFWLSNFRQRGIRPGNTPNEFSQDPGFYCTNFLKGAYEHVLLNHGGIPGGEDTKIHILNQMTCSFSDFRLTPTCCMV